MPASEEKRSSSSWEFGLPGTEDHGIWPRNEKILLGHPHWQARQSEPIQLSRLLEAEVRNKGGKEPWYILTSLSSLSEALKLYECRWGIEMMFKDYKTGGYNLEDTQVKNVRFLSLVLLIAIAYSLATCMGQSLGESQVDVYVSRPPEAQRRDRRHSKFGIGLYGYQWCHGMAVWSEYAFRLINLKAHKRRYFLQGLRALSVIQTELQLPCHP